MDLWGLNEKYTCFCELNTRTHTKGSNRSRHQPDFSVFFCTFSHIQVWALLKKKKSFNQNFHQHSATVAKVRRVQVDTVIGIHLSPTTFQVTPLILKLPSEKAR